MRCVYVDLDGTLLGAHASFLHDADGNFSLLGARVNSPVLRIPVAATARPVVTSAA